MSAEEIFKKHHPLIYGMGTGEFKNNFISAMEEYASQFSQSQRKVVTNEMIIDAGAEYFNNEKTYSNKYVAFREGAKWMRDLLSDNGK